jgi:hypothetical protein
VPRTVGITELAKQLGISHQATSQRRRRQPPLLTACSCKHRENKSPSARLSVRPSGGATIVRGIHRSTSGSRRPRAARPVGSAADRTPDRVTPAGVPHVESGSRTPETSVYGAVARIETPRPAKQFGTNDITLRAQSDRHG